MLGRNRLSFYGFVLLRDLLRDYSIDITDSDDYDYMFLGANEILDKGKSIEESVDKGLKKCSEITGDYFIFEGNDSTSLIGSYEILANSNAMFLFKNQLLSNKEQYKTKSNLNKWFFGYSEDGVGYDIDDENWKKIKLSGWNLGYLKGDGFRPYQESFGEICVNKKVDLCAIYQSFHKENYEHKIRNDMFYTNHRSGAWDVIGETPKYTFVKKRLPFNEYMQILYQSKMALSPFGMGELCYRDFEIMDVGVAMLKPDMSCINTTPNPFVDGETYIKLKLDWSDLNESVLKFLDNQVELNRLVNNFRKVYKKEYSAHNFCKYWYDFFSTLNTVAVSDG